MKRKPLNLCREFGCRRRTWSKRPEKDIQLRFCSYHDPKLMAQRLKALEKGRPKKKDRPAVKKRPRRNRFFIPLVCVFRNFQMTNDERFVFTSNAMCGKNASRHPLQPDYPAHPTRHLDPLCSEHVGFADDERIFPGDVEPQVNELVLQLRRSASEKGTKKLTSLLQEAVTAFSEAKSIDLMKRSHLEQIEQIEQTSESSS